MRLLVGRVQLLLQLPDFRTKILRVHLLGCNKLLRLLQFDFESLFLSEKLLARHL